MYRRATSCPPNQKITPARQLRRLRDPTSLGGAVPSNLESQQPIGHLKKWSQRSAISKSRSAGPYLPITNVSGPADCVGVSRYDRPAGSLQIEAPRFPDPIMRRPWADREEKRVTHAKGRRRAEELDPDNPNQRGLSESFNYSTETWRNRVSQQWVLVPID